MTVTPVAVPDAVPVAVKIPVPVPVPVKHGHEGHCGRGGAMTPICDTSSQQCVQCQTGADCAGNDAGATHCSANNTCVECTGNAVPQNAEYVFRNLPALKLQLDYDHKIWESRLTPGENQTQRLILAHL